MRCHACDTRTHGRTHEQWKVEQYSVWAESAKREYSVAYTSTSCTIKSNDILTFGVDYISLSCWWPFRKYEKCLTLTSYLHSVGRKRIRPALIHIPTMETPKMHFSPSSCSYSTDLISNVRLINPTQPHKVEQKMHSSAWIKTLTLPVKRTTNSHKACVVTVLELRYLSKRL